MVKKKDTILGEKELEKVRNNGKIRYDVTVKYRDGGVDDFHGMKSVRVMDNVLELVESTSTTVYLVLSVVTYFRIEKIEEVSK